MKVSFKNDYSEGCHPRILDALTKTNLEQQNGYGLDEYCVSASNLIRNKCGSPLSKVHFVSGGTQANLLVISAALKPFESVIAATTGHIYTNEAGAIEATGHKVNTIATEDGKLTVDHITAILDGHQNTPHVVKPKMVYISNATEIGTIYSKKELQSLYKYCNANALYLFMDGARLGSGLMASTSDLSLADVAKYTDVFWLGGTKNGALIGEAIVINNADIQSDFEFHLKQKGAMLSKGRLLGIQFNELLKDDLFFDLARHANLQAMKLKEALTAKGHSFLSETHTNQIFPILPNTTIDELSENFDFHIWKKINDSSSAIRLIASWATTDAQVASFVEALKRV
ncbi:MAG TPA: threonine aldolase [Bacteroidetes bacterium]|nr:threonine aldolase [Bacteroidota bacterium]